jgi:hypothetical protein
MRLAELRQLAKSDVLAAFEGAIDLLRDLVRAAAVHDRELMALRRDVPREAGAALTFLGGLLGEDARRKAHELDRESAWFTLFEIWLEDDAGLLRDFEGRVARIASLESDRRLLVRLATEALADLPVVFPAGDSGLDARRAVLAASRSRLESLIAALLAADGRHAYGLAVGENLRRRTGDSAILVEALLRSSDSDAAVAAAERALTDPREARSERIHALLGEAIERRSSGRALRIHLETAFLRHPTRASFAAVKRAVPAEQWPRVRTRLLGHLQKHQREPTLTFQLYWDEGLVLDADGLVVTQPVDPDVLARAANALATSDPTVAAGWLLVAAYRLADSHPRSRWPDVVSHLLAVRELASRGAGGFDRVMRTFRFRHEHAPELLSLVARAGL